MAHLIGQLMVSFGLDLELWLGEFAPLASDLRIFSFEFLYQIMQLLFKIRVRRYLGVVAAVSPGPNRRAPGSWGRTLQFGSGPVNGGVEFSKLFKIWLVH